MSDEFSRENEGKSSPKKLATEALEHFRLAREQVGDSPEEIRADEAKVRKGLRNGRMPTLPQLDPATLRKFGLVPG